MSRPILAKDFLTSPYSGVTNNMTDADSIMLFDLLEMCNHGFCYDCPKTVREKLGAEWHNTTITTYCNCYCHEINKFPLQSI